MKKGGNNHFCIDELGVKGLPTIKWYTGDKDSGEKYTEKRDLKSIKDFV